MKELSLLFLKLVVLFLYLCSSVLSDCPALYRRYSKEHTFCKTKNQKCHIKRWGVSEDDREIIIDLHNKVRNNIALGKDQSGRLPAAGDMLEMEWDDELAQIAQKLTDQCVYKHDCDDCRKVENFDVGQNIYTATITAVDPPEPFWVDAVRSWYSEIYRFTPDFIKPFTSDHATGHFTQMAWSKTWRVGCGYVLYEKRKDSWTQLYVCNYGPAGNMDDSELYKIDKPCEKCPGNTCCGPHCKKKRSTSYLGLCSVLNGRGPDFDDIDFSNYIFNCDFKPESSSDCNNKVEGSNKWQTRQIISDVYKTVVLNGGESTTLKFTSNIQYKDGFCLTISFRKGPSVAGTKNAGEFNVQLERKGASPLNFQLDSEGNEWLPYSMGIPMKQPMLINLKFSVPKGSPAQYLDISYIRARPGVCN